MSNAPTIVRLIRFPASLRLTRKGKQFIGPQRRSGPVILSERHDPIDCTFRITVPGVTFTTGGTTITHTEAFNEGEQRDLLLPWGLIVDADARIPQIILEIDVSYSGTTDLHTATAPVKLTYGVAKRRAVALAGAAVAAAAIGAAVAAKRKKAVVVDDEDDVELAVFNIASTKRAPAKASTKRPPKGSKITVVDEDDAEVTVYNTGRRPASSKKTSSSKKASSSTKKASSKKTSAKKASTAKKSSSKKQAGGTRRGSGASRSTPRTGARGSSSARKSASRRTTRKSR
jgi:hypothetical protein